MEPGHRVENPARELRIPGREWLAKIPVTVRTASAVSADVLKANLFGARRFLQKADDFGELVVAVREELGVPEGA